MYKGRRKKVFKSLEDNSMLLLYSGVAPKEPLINFILMKLIVTFII